MHLPSTKDSKLIRIAVDVMGGDYAPDVPLAGIKNFIQNFAEEFDYKIHFNLFGPEKVRRKIPGTIKKYVTFFPAEQVVSNDEKPTVVLRHFKNSSMGLAIKSVADNVSNACVSGGNTGALMVLSKVLLKTIDQIRRPAICSLMPSSSQQKVVLLDMGANISCDPHMLLEFAVMGCAFVRSLSDCERPKVGIVNIGSETSKGTEVLQKAHELCSSKFSNGDFVGFIEPDEIVKGEVNVVVTDGFTGNIIIKSMEGVGKMIRDGIKNSLHKATLVEKLLAYPFLRFRLSDFASNLDSNKYNGGMLIGLNGIVVKSHGSSKESGFANALSVAHSLARRNVIGEIRKNINLTHQSNNNSTIVSGAENSGDEAKSDLTSDETPSEVSADK